MKRQAFKPVEDNVSDKRRKILNLHLHPIMTHFSNGFSSFLVIIILFTMVFPDFFRTELLNTIFVLSVLLPLAVLITMLAGIFDGKNRFKSLNTPYLKQKLLLGLIFLVLSSVLAAYAMIFGVALETLLFLLILSSACLLCGGLLGKIGGSLICAKLPD